LNKSNGAPSAKFAGFYLVMRTWGNSDKTRGNSDLVTAGLVPGIPIVGHRAILVIAATSPAMKKRADMAFAPVTIRIGAEQGAAFGAKSR
jgi:hypothetical protein